MGENIAVHNSWKDPIDLDQLSIYTVVGKHRDEDYGDDMYYVGTDLTEARQAKYPFEQRFGKVLLKEWRGGHHCKTFSAHLDTTFTTWTEIYNREKILDDEIDNLQRQLDAKYDERNRIKKRVGGDCI